MKTVFKFALLASAGTFAGCIDLEAPPQDGSTSECCAESGTAQASGADEDPSGAPGRDEEGTDDCGTCPSGHGLSGEVVLFVNGRLTSAEGLYQSNTPLGDPGTYVGSDIYIYDPDATCEDGTTACRLARLGSLRLDETLGDISVSDGSLKKFGLRELAWSETHGLWGVSYDVLNDEWGIAEIHVPDWHARDQELPLDRYVILPGDPQSPGTDPCYWQENVSGLAFFGDELLLGVRGLGGTGISNDGRVFRVALDVVREQGWCVYENDISHDPHYYACDVLCQPWADFGPALGVAGDLETAADDQQVLALARAEDETIMPLDRQELYRMAPPVEGTSTPQATGLYVEGIAPGLDIEGLARVNGTLVGIDVWAKLWSFDEAGGGVAVLEDLASHFDDPSQSLRIRGATMVTIAPDDG